MARALVKTHFEPLTAILEDRKSSNTSGGTYTAGVWQSRILNILSGDTSFVSLDDEGATKTSGIDGDTRQFNLDEGIYEVEYWGQIYALSNNKCRVYDVTNSSALDILGSGGAFSAGGAMQAMKGKISIDSATTFRVEVRGSNTRATQGLGFPTNFGEDEIYAQLKITKVG